VRMLRRPLYLSGKRARGDAAYGCTGRVRGIKALRALPERKPGMREAGTGRTIAQEWEAADMQRRRQILAEFNVRVVVNPRKTYKASVTVPAISEKKPRVVIAGTKAPRLMLAEAA
jgi:hypothetical protein